jgi:hypothetical protein
MSDYHDVVYDPRIHTHTSCIDEVSGCDAVVVIIGSRFGGASVPQALERVDFESVEKLSSSIEALKKKDAISVTQLEVLKAVECSIPIFSFVEERVWNDHATYEKNKSKSIAGEIEYSSIDKPESAKYIFEFINFLRHRTRNNGVNSFSKYQEIEESLRRQWSGILQRLLSEQRQKVVDARRIDTLSEQFEDLKAAMLSTIGDDNRREIARGVVQFRKLNDFFVGLGSHVDVSTLLVRQNFSWNDFLLSLNIENTLLVPRDLGRSLQSRNGARLTALLVKDNQAVIALYFPLDLEILTKDFESFMKLSEQNKRIIMEALNEGKNSPVRAVEFIQSNLDNFLSSLIREKDGQNDWLEEVILRIKDVSDKGST